MVDKFSGKEEFIIAYPFLLSYQESRGGSPFRVCLEVKIKQKLIRDWSDFDLQNFAFLEIPFVFLQDKLFVQPSLPNCSSSYSFWFPRAKKSQ